MLSPYPGEIIRQINEVDGIVYERFTAASGIEGNIKFNFAEALFKLPAVRKTVVSCMAESLKGVDVVTGVASGGLELAAEVAFETGKPLVVAEKYRRSNRNGFHIPSEMKELLNGCISIGMVEDETTTMYSILKLANHPYLRGKVTHAVTGLRRGLPAPASMSRHEINDHNRRFAFKPPLELALPFPVDSVVERPLPLWIPREKQIASWLPEINETRD